MFRGSIDLRFNSKTIEDFVSFYDSLAQTKAETTDTKKNEIIVSQNVYVWQNMI